MCGISGYLLRNETASAENIIRMNQAIRHRGPDDEGYVCLAENRLVSYAGEDTIGAVKVVLPILEPSLKTNIALGFRRLSILDLSENGHQPMVYENICLTFNGEIYNFLPLRSQLQALGHQFKSNSDTEVVLHAYLEWGLEMVHRLNGMFAMAILDLRLQKTFLIRDRLGIKPLFYHQTQKDITWCSEIKGILKADWVRPKMAISGLILNYQFKTSPPPATCFENIFSVEPGHILTIDNKSLKTKSLQYWKIPVNEIKLDVSIDEAVILVQEQLKKSVSTQLQADVPLISMMSGGVDSTLITAFAKEKDPSMSCYTLSIDGSGSGLDELPQATKMAERLGIKQYVQRIGEEDYLQAAIENLSHFEEPYNSLDVVFNAAQFLKERDYKVVLSGNGADEVFGGYGYNLNLNKWRKLKSLGSLPNLLPNLGSTVSKLKYYASLKDVGHYFLSTTGGLRKDSIAALLSQKSKNDIQQLTEPYVQKSDFNSDYEGLFYYDLKYSVGAHHVYHDDLCAMRYSVEMRYPYLDHDLIELVSSLPENIRFNGVQAKPLLRKAAANYIESDNLKMSKKGFALPLDHAMENNPWLKDYVIKQLDFLKQTGVFNPKAIDRIVEEGKKRRFYLTTWQLVSTAQWMQTYL